MNSIVFTHFVNRGQSACPLELALARLSAYLDSEEETLARVLALAGRSNASTHLNALSQLHLKPNAGPAGLRDLLEEAQMYLEYLLDVVRGIPSSCRLVSAWGPQGPAPFDTHVRWSGARLDDIVQTLAYALRR